MPDHSDGGQSSGKTFVIGLALAGAISAGAYTAGVLDFLIEALEEWEAARKRGEPVPAHHVAIAAISGTSAGGICAPLLAAAIAHSDQPLRDAQREIKAYLPRLYDAWVTRTKLFAERDDEISFTSDEDLKSVPPQPVDYAGRSLRKQKRVKSLLNGALLERIASTELTVTGNAPFNKTPRPYISSDLHLFLMTGNLRGVPYGITFAQKQKHGMVLHADRIHAAVANLGDHRAKSAWASREKASIPLSATELGTSTELDPQWERVRIAALATCAFPAGLPSRIVRETGADKANLVWPISSGYQDDDPAYPGFVPDWPNASAPQSYSYVSADGGIANNEPFEYARWSIMAKPPEPNQRNEALADRAVIMIDPFPEPPDFDLGPDDDSMVATLQRLIATLIDQARFKFVELAEAQSEGVASRYLVAPSRAAANAAAGAGASLQTGINAIATGLIGGFGGFVAEELRAHDYQLGRRNCQRFLREHFALPEGNPIFAGDANAARFATTTPGSRADVRYFPIIPLVGESAKEVPEPRWQRLDRPIVDRVMKAAERRLNRVVPILLQDEFGGFVGWVAGVAWPALRGGILDRVRAAIMSDVIRRDQYVPTQALSDAERRLLGLMYSDFSTQLTKFGLARRYAEHVTSKGGEAMSLAAIEAALAGPLAPFVTRVGSRRTKDLTGRDNSTDAWQVREFAPGLWDQVKSVINSPTVD